VSSSDPVSDPVASVAKGVTKGTLEHIEEKISGWVKKLQNGELGFIEDLDTVERVKSQKQKPGWKVYERYVKDCDLRLQIQMGFCLRDLEQKGKNEKLHKLRDVILTKYGPNGLTVAELTQRGLLDRYVALLVTKTEDEKSLQKGIEEVLNDASKYVFPIKSQEDVEFTSRIIIARINGASPRAIILLSKGKDAERKASSIFSKVKTNISGYNTEIQTEPDLFQNYYFFFRDDVNIKPIFDE